MQQLSDGPYIIPVLYMLIFLFVVARNGEEQGDKCSQYCYEMGRDKGFQSLIFHIL